MLRRYTPLAPSRGEVIPPAVRAAVYLRDEGCVGRRIGPPFPSEHSGPVDLDHVRSSGALGLKSASTADNLVVLCRYQCHRWKTDHGRTARPLLLAYLETVADPHSAHVDPCPECPRRAHA